MVSSLRGLNYPDRLNKLNLPTLMYRPLRGDMIEIFKMVSGAYDEQVIKAIIIISSSSSSRSSSSCDR